MRKPPTAPAATLVIFGALGDLTRRLQEANLAAIIAKTLPPIERLA
jgi:hypothetical protein